MPVKGWRRNQEATSLLLRVQPDCQCRNNTACAVRTQERSSPPSICQNPTLCGSVMPRLYERLGFSNDPFEHYVAETEPDIAEYAVKPPYFETVERRVTSHLPYVLFGDRGAGKSATRLTVYREFWKKRQDNGRVPLVINFTDFERVAFNRKLEQILIEHYVAETGFLVIEALLTFLSALEDEDRQIYVDGLNSEENNLFWSLSTRLYFNAPEAIRAVSLTQACRMFDQAWRRRTGIWIERRWNEIAALFARISDILASRAIGSEANASSSIEAILARKDNNSTAQRSVFVLGQLVSLARVFGFSGIACLVDKVDEHPSTQNSAEMSASLIHSALAHVQTLEVEGFSWIFFLWDRIKAHLDSSKYYARLDKVGYATADWDTAYLQSMVHRRVSYYSRGRLEWKDLFEDSLTASAALDDMVLLAMRSPRELIRVIDTTIREFDQDNSRQGRFGLLTRSAVEKGCDIYCRDRAVSIYGERPLSQLSRLNKEKFLNKDVQQAFRINDASARNRIVSWENMGIVRKTGVGVAEGGAGGKPPIQYSVVGARIIRIMKNNLMEPEDLFGVDVDS